MERMEALTNYYTTHNEDARLAPKRGMVEFLTTIHYVEKYLKPGMRILEIGAGTGRYSHYFAQNGYDVDAVEMMECNIEVFKANTKDGENITVQQGDAVDLQNIASDQYDITLLLGPMYHLYARVGNAEQIAQLSFFNKRLYSFLSKSLPLFFSEKMRLFSMPNSLNAAICRCKFWSFADTRAYA